MIGSALSKIGNFGDLDNKQQVVALVNDVRENGRLFISLLDHEISGHVYQLWEVLHGVQRFRLSSDNL